MRDDQAATHKLLVLRLILAALALLNFPGAESAPDMLSVHKSLRLLVAAWASGGLLCCALLAAWWAMSF